MNKNQLTGKGVPETVDHYQNIKTEKDLRAYCRSQGLPVYSITVSKREIETYFRLIPENFPENEKGNSKLEEKKSTFAQPLEGILIRELEAGIRDLSAFVRYKSSWGDTWARIEQGKKIEEFNLLQGMVYRYWNHDPDTGEKRAEFSFEENPGFPYAFTDIPQLNENEPPSVSE